MQRSAFKRTLLLIAMFAFITIGCSDDDTSNGITDPILTGQGGIVLLMHDAPIDSLREVWLTVNSVRLLTADEADDDTTEVDDDSTGTDDSKGLALDEPIRMNLLALDSISRVLAVTSAPAGVYTKLRLYVSDPFFVLDNGTEITSDQIKLVANGKVDLNPQGDVIVTTDAFTVVSLDLDVENSIQVNQTGNEKYILRPQVFVDATVDSMEAVEILGASIETVDSENGTLTISVPGSDESLVVMFDENTALVDGVGSAIESSALIPGAIIAIVGYLDTDDLHVVAQTIIVGS